MTDAIENAFLFLLGQIAIITSFIAFGIPFYFFSESIQVDIKLNTEVIYFLAFVFIISIMMIINIIIGWSALRELIKSGNEYNTQMFVIDLFIIVILFSMNNVIMFVLGDSLSFENKEVILEILKGRIGLKTMSIMSASLAFLTSVFLLLCKFWNKQFYKSSGIKKKIYKEYEIQLWIVIVLCLISSVLSLIFRNSLLLQIAFSLVLVSSWSFINGSWLYKNFVKNSN